MMDAKFLIALFLVFTVSVSPNGLAQVPVPRADQDIIVKSRPSTSEARSLADKLTGTRGYDQVSRWSNRLCISVEGVNENAAAFIKSRIEQTALSVGLPNVTGKCEVNLYVLFPLDADAYTKELLTQHPALFRDVERIGFGSPKQLELLRTPQPVRWIAVSKLGRPGIMTSSHITTNTKVVKTGEIVIVDTKKVAGINLNQIADYVTVVALADPDMNGDYVDDDTILSIFARRDRGGSGPAGLTTEDRALLRGFYKFDPLTQKHIQVGTIVDVMTKDAATSKQTKPTSSLVAQ